MPHNKNVIGRIVSRLRYQRGWSQSDLARRAKVALRTIRRMEGFDGLRQQNVLGASRDREITVGRQNSEQLPAVFRAERNTARADR